MEYQSNQKYKYINIYLNHIKKNQEIYTESEGNRINYKEKINSPELINDHNYDFKNEEKKIKHKNNITKNSDKKVSNKNNKKLSYKNNNYIQKDKSEDNIKFNRKTQKESKLFIDLKRSKSQIYAIHKNKYQKKKIANKVENTKNPNYYNKKLETEIHSNNFHNNKSIYNITKIKNKNEYINGNLKNNQIFIEGINKDKNINTNKSYTPDKKMKINNLYSFTIHKENNDINKFKYIKTDNSNYNNTYMDIDYKNEENYEFLKTNINNNIIKPSLSDTNILNNKIFNIIYLIDTTYSMKKYKTFIYSLSKINQILNQRFRKMKIGYVLYKDFNNKEGHKLDNHIKKYEPSKSNIDIPNTLEFSGGYDYSEDWGLPINTISEIAKEDEQNIVIHICDSNAHGERFSDYDEKNEEEEKILIQALERCKNKNIKFIGLLIDDFSFKSFNECKKIYNELNGYYEIIDICDFSSLLKLSDILTKKINNIINNKYKIEWNNFREIDENDFELNYKIKMKPLYDIEEYKGKKFSLLPSDDFNEIHGITQGNIGDCFLISSIISMTNIPLIFHYIFQNSLNINENTKYIKMFIYKNGIRKLISFKNTYPTSDGKLIFCKPKDNEIYGIALEKGYAISKCKNNKIESGYYKINEGGFPFEAFETILGVECEKYYSNDYTYDKVNLQKHNYKYIDEYNLKLKIIKYIDLGGIISFGVFFNLGGGHAYSLYGYIIDEKGNMLIIIINPNRIGNYAEENIYFDKDTNKSKLLDNSTNKFPIISTDDFTNEECRESLNSYEKTGYLIMEFKTFYKWYSCIDMCDPMIGYYEQIIEFIPRETRDNNLYIFSFQINKEIKFSAYIFIKNDENRNINKYNLIIKNKDDDVIFNDESNYNNKIFYGLLEKNDYDIIIKSRNGKKIKDVIYLKIYSPEKITKNEYNNIINLRQKYIEIYPQYKFIKEFIPKFYKFIKNNNIDLITMPNKESIYSIINDYEKYFYFYIIHTTFGFYANVIFEYKWQFIYKIKYQYNKSNYMIITTRGNFKSNEEFRFFDFSDDFKKNIFKNTKIKEPILWSDIVINTTIEDIIHKNIDNAIYKNPEFLDTIDVIYLIDSTASMGDEVKNASNLSINNANYLSRIYPNIDFQFGFIYYNDPIDVDSDKHGYLQLTKDFTEIKKFCDGWKTQAGGDGAEDWAGGYDYALTKIKWRNGKKFIIHICDAPAHGALFSKNSHDNHKEEKYEKDLENKMKKCAENKIAIVGFYKYDVAKDCFLECKKIYDNNNGESFTIHQYDPKRILNFIN